MSPSMSNATHRPSGLTSTLIHVPSLVWKSSVRSKPRFFATSHLLSALCCAGRLATDSVTRGSAASRQSVRRMDGPWSLGLLPAAELCPSAHSSATQSGRENAENGEKCFLPQRRRDAENCFLPPRTPRTPRTTFTAENAETAESASAARHFDRRHLFKRFNTSWRTRAQPREVFQLNNAALSECPAVNSR